MRASEKLLYGFGDLGNSLTYTTIGFYFLFYLTDIVKIDPAIAGTILFLVKIWDAIIDPFIGTISDSTKSKWGRRAPFFLFFSFPYALTFILLWLNPFTNNLKIIYVLLIYPLYVTFASLIQIPYNTLSAELENDYDERTSMTAYRMFFSIIGSLLVAVVPMLIVNGFSSKRFGFFIMGLVIAIPSFFSALSNFIITKNHYYSSKVMNNNFTNDFNKKKLKKNDINKSEIELENRSNINKTNNKGFKIQFDNYKILIKGIFKNRPFIWVMLIYLFTWMMVAVVSATLIYYIKYVLNNEKLTSVILGSIFITAIIFLPFWVKISKTIGKKKSFTIGMGSLAIILAIFSIINVKSYFIVYFLAFLSGFGVACAHVIPWAMIPDVIEYDELKTGQRREGIFNGVISFMQQLSSSAAMLFIGFILKISGYVPNAVQKKSALIGIRFLTGGLTSILIILAIISAYFYPITKQKHSKILNLLKQKKKLNVETD